MALKLLSQRAKQTGYLAVCIILFLYTLSGLMFQGGIWLLTGAFCWIGIVSSFLISNINHYNKIRSFEISINPKKKNSEKIEKDKSNLGFRYFPNEQPTR
jgi:hypothetical protein